MAWTDERVETLKSMWLGGSSASQIAAALGDVTRNAVIGKVHRLGLSGRGKPTSTATPKVRKPRSSTPRTRRPSRPTQPLVSGATALKGHPDFQAEYLPVEELRPRVELTLVGESPRLSVHELTEATCKWPVGDPLSDDFHFCGRQAGEGSPYCSYHSKIAYQTPNERKRERRQS